MWVVIHCKVVYFRFHMIRSFAKYMINQKVIKIFTPHFEYRNRKIECFKPIINCLIRIRLVHLDGKIQNRK